MKKINPCLFPFLLCILTLLVCMPSFVTASDCDKARQIYDRAVAVSDYNVKAKLYQKAVDLCPDYADAHNNLADAFEHLAKYDEAIAEYRQAIRLNPDLAVAYFGLGDTCLRIGLFKKAEKAYEAGLKLKPTDHLAKKGLSIARRGVLCAQEKELISYITILNNLKDHSIKAMGPGGVRQRVSRIRFSNILFDFNSSDIKPDSIPQLNEIGKALSSPSVKGLHFIIEGHTDNIGAEQYNMDLSSRRGKSVRRYLTENFKVQNALLKVNGCGEMRPLAENTSAEGRRKNRRVEMVAIHQ
ncbi:MAG: OmpA family protein [Desulfobacterales bacterium]|nr:OmpA family protein [Desulfobacterales bacterium]